jgi:DNA-binding transcriptional ArsR family regulator
MKIKTSTQALAADEVGGLLKALASPCRLEIVCRLIEEEQSVGALAAAIGARESLVSQHLAILRRERIVTARRQGQSMLYAVASPLARAIVETIASEYCADSRATRIERDQTPRRLKEGK